MWTPFSDYDRRTVAPWSDVFRQLDRAWRAQPSGVDQSVTLSETPEAIELRLDVPGVREADIRLDVHDAQTVTIAAKRTIAGREGYATHRAERQGFEWKRSYTLPAKVDATTTSATLAQGVLTVKLAKLPESQPRRVQINAQAR